MAHSDSTTVHFLKDDESHSFIRGVIDGYYMAYKPIILLYISFMFIDNEIYSFYFLCDI